MIHFAVLNVHEFISPACDGGADGDTLTEVLSQVECNDCRAALLYEPTSDKSPAKVSTSWTPEPLPNADEILADVAARKTLMGPDHVREDVVFCNECDCLHLASDGACEPFIAVEGADHMEFEAKTNGEVLR